MAAPTNDRTLTLGELLGAAAGGHHATRIADLVLDSREARPGAAFVAVQGGREHGLRHAADAVARGAPVVLFEPPAVGDAVPAVPASRCIAVPDLKRRLGELARRLYGPALGSPALCGVTGTNGKTTVAYLLAQAMTSRGESCGYVGTLGYGVPPRLVPHALTTPDTFTLHRELIALGAPHAALEVSSHALSQDRIAGLALETAAFTNLTRDHLDEHGDLGAYGRAKASLFGRHGLRRAVLNVADPFGAQLARRLPPSVEPIRVACATGAAAEGADLRAEVSARGLAGLELAIAGRYGQARLASPLVGGFNAENLLVALGVLLAWHVPLEEACAALALAAPPPGRLEVVNARREEAGAGRARSVSAPTGERPALRATAGEPKTPAPWVVVDYAHTPDGLVRSLDALRAVAAGGELWCVFGCGGDRDRGKRPLMGAAAAARAEHVVVTDDNPRSEDPHRIVEDVLAGTAAHPHVVVEHDRRRAIEFAVHAARPGDVVLIAGKGHETTQLAGGVAAPFDDRAVARAALGARP
ncbi:MAG: UDP-N-acetylmuramoyl-L-alanyl-D-glutamate--2,6-diaminopimelate ligase [Gammaproteobacteria bacterium]|nr:UDP-N-acetylmuramoyl-L-alanyl-D-glutamate--2,6-diaminopimelate ligase [Gammaproteobacteria bacterium]